MKAITNQMTSIKQGRKYYHIDDCDIPGIIHVKRIERLDKAFLEKDFQAFSSKIRKGIEKISQNPSHKACDRYID